MRFERRVRKWVESLLDENLFDASTSLTDEITRTIVTHTNRMILRRFKGYVTIGFVAGSLFTILLLRYFA